MYTFYNSAQYVCEIMLHFFLVECSLHSSLILTKIWCSKFDTCTLARKSLRAPIHEIVYQLLLLKDCTSVK